MSNAHDKRSPRVGRGLKRGWEKIQLDRVLSDTLRPLTICVSPRGLLFTLISYPSFSTNLVPLCLFVPLFLRLPLALVFSFSLCLMLSSFLFSSPSTPFTPVPEFETCTSPGHPLQFVRGVFSHPSVGVAKGVELLRVFSLSF